MKVILLKNVSGLGHLGDVKEVKEGYGRNFLIPRGLAQILTPQVQRQINSHKNAIEKKQGKNIKKNKALAKKIDNLRIEIKVKADESKTLFGSITAKIIADELGKRGYEINSSVVSLDEPIKKLGYYDVPLVFGPAVKAKIGITVTRE